MGDRASADALRWNLDLALDQRGADTADPPGGASGMLVRDYKGKEADRLETRIDPGVVSLVAELRGHERQAAEELDQRKTRGEERRVIDASPAAMTLVLLLTGVELDSLEKRAGEREIAGRGRPGGSDVASPQAAARHGEPAQVFPANAAAPGRSKYSREGTEFMMDVPHAREQVGSSVGVRHRAG